MGIPGTALGAESAKLRPISRSVAGTDRGCAIARRIPITPKGIIERRLLRMFEMLCNADPSVMFINSRSPACISGLR